jgi:hypothetical protein
VNISTQDKRLADDQSATQSSSERRAFLKVLGAGVLGTTVAAATIGRAEAKPEFESLWDSGQVFIGNSPTEQVPNSVIQCPMFSANGDFAHAFHGLDLSNPQRVSGTVTVHDETVEPNFGSAIAVAVTQGFDGVTYLLVAGEGTITSGTGYFRRFNKAVIRCKYKVPAGSNPQSPVLLIKCVDCVLILAHKG